MQYSSGMKTTFKNVAIVVVVLAMALVVLTAIDKASDIGVSASKTAIKVTVVDLDNNPVHNAVVTIGGNTFFCDNNGNSPVIQLQDLSNCYDKNISTWHTQTVVITKDGYVPTVVLNCVVFDKETRKLTVKIYPVDQSNLPYVCYVETPPSDYILQISGQK